MTFRIPIIPKRCAICGRLVFFNRLEVTTWDDNTNRILMHLVDNDFLTAKEKAFVFENRRKDGTLIGKETFHIKCYKAHYPEHAIPP
jgi:hypothetical protein